MKEQNYFRGQYFKTINGFCYIDVCHKDGTYTLRNFYSNKYIGRFTKEELGGLIKK